jgi:hypothetical protein
MSAPEIKFYPGPPATERRYYTVNGVEVPSVTQILDCLHKPALVWWGMTTGVEGVVALIQNRAIEFESATPEEIVAALTANKLTVNHIRDKAGTRGAGVHQALEDYMRSQKLPTLADYPEAERGYVRALASFLFEHRPEPLAIEHTVGSVTHGYAGRYDLRCRIGGRVGLLDAKTSKRVYPESHFPQLEAYEAAAVECGADPTDFRAVLRLGADGKYELAESTATFEDFLGIKAAYDALARIKAAVKQRKAEAKERAKAKKLAAKAAA